MEVHTKKFQLTPNMMFRGALETRLHKSWWMFAIIFGVAIINLPRFQEGPLEQFIVIFGLVYPFISIGYLWFWSYKQRDEIFFEPQYLSIIDEKIVSRLEDGTKSEIDLDRIKRVVSRKKYWLIYISGNQFFYVPIDAFENEADRQTFNEILDTIN